MAFEFPYMLNFFLIFNKEGHTLHRRSGDSFSKTSYGTKTKGRKGKEGSGAIPWCEVSFSQMGFQSTNGVELDLHQNLGWGCRRTALYK